jgi:chromosome segregation ATPase
MRSIFAKQDNIDSGLQIIKETQKLYILLLQQIKAQIGEELKIINSKELADLYTEYWAHIQDKTISSVDKKHFVEGKHLEIMAGINRLIESKNQQRLQEIDELVGRNAEISRENRELVGRNAELDQVNRELVGRNAKLANENSELKSRNTKLGQVNSELVGRNEQHDKANSELKSRNAKLANENGEMKSRNTKLGQVNGELVGRNEQLDKANSELIGRNAKLANENGELKDRNTRLTDEIGELKENIRILEENIERVGENIKEYEIENKKLKNKSDITRELLKDIEKKYSSGTNKASFRKLLVGDDLLDRLQKWNEDDNKSSIKRGTNKYKKYKTKYIMLKQKIN